MRRRSMSSPLGATVTSTAELPCSATPTAAACFTRALATLLRSTLTFHRAPTRGGVPRPAHRGAATGRLDLVRSYVKHRPRRIPRSRGLFRRQVDPALGSVQEVGHEDPLNSSADSRAPRRVGAPLPCVLAHPPALAGGPPAPDRWRSGAGEAELSAEVLHVNTRSEAPPLGQLDELGPYKAVPASDRAAARR
jgi:hypothetical protein